MTNISPVPRFPERGRQEIDKIVAVPRRNAMGQRAGNRPFQEGLDQEPGVAGGFAGGAADPHGIYDAKMAEHAYGRDALAEGRFVPTWDAVDPQMLRGFTAGAIGERLRSPDFSFTGREMNPSPQTDLSRALGAGERPRQQYTTVIAPENGGRRVNRADIREL